VLDLGAFAAPAAAPAEELAAAARRAAAARVAEASARLGSFWVDTGAFSEAWASAAEAEGEGADRFRTSAVISCVDQLFGVPEDEKHEFGTKRLGGARGFIGYGAESGSPEFFENKEGFCFGFSDWGGAPPSGDLEEHNAWPRSVPGAARRVLERRLFGVFRAIGEALVRAYSLVLYGDESVLPDSWSGGERISIARVFRYFDEGVREARRHTSANRETLASLGSSPHTDWGLLTLIAADDCPGLQLSCDGEWRTVTPKFSRDLVFVNCGDYMSILSAGRFVSPLHRVLSPGQLALAAADEAPAGEPPAKRAAVSPAAMPASPAADGPVGNGVARALSKLGERRSIVFFFYPRYDAKIPEPANGEGRQQFYSVLADQSQDAVDPQAAGARHAQDVKKISFGEWLSSKWKSVAR